MTASSPAATPLATASTARKAAPAVLVTGAAGFIGYHVCDGLLADGTEVIGVDSLNDYYDPGLKQARLARLAGRPGFRFERVDLADRPAAARLFAASPGAVVIHLAAQAGVRWSIERPEAYVDSNLVGFANVLEGCRRNQVRHLVYASSSSVYGERTDVPFSTDQRTDAPVSFYAATKKANEAMAHAYSHLYRFPATGLRFFTVYGPWGRPDMAYYGFTRAIFAGEPIALFNEGRMLRDFTYIDDIVEGVMRVANTPADSGSPEAPHRILNIGNHQSVPLGEFVATLEGLIGREAVKRLLPMQPGDVPVTCADVEPLRRLTGFAPSTPLADGLRRFVDWYRAYHGV